MFRLAVGQVSGSLDPEERMEWLEGVLANLDADMLVLPELFATGYNVAEALVARAQAFDGPMARRISAVAKHHGIAIHYGFSEPDGDVLYNSAQCFGADGARLGGHRKLVIPPGFEADYFATGSGCEVFTYQGIRFGMLICYDAEFPEAARHVAGLGAEVVLVPTALGADWEYVAQTLIPARAFENGVYLAYANSADAENGLAYLGQSFIGSPDGEILARAGQSAEVIVAEIDIARVRAAQKLLPYLTERFGLKL